MPRIKGNDLDRFWSKVTRDGKWNLVRGEWSQCWEWIGSCNKDGYGNFWVKDKCFGSHRWIYEQIHGSIGELETDHLCRNRKCVRDDHIEPVTRKTNILRGIGPTAINAQKETCPKGHFLDKVRSDNGHRYCRECDLERKKEYYQTKGKFIPLTEEQKEHKREYDKQRKSTLEYKERRKEERKREWQRIKNNPEKITKEKERKSSEAYKQQNKERERVRYYLKTYGMTEEEYKTKKGNLNVSYNSSQ